MKITNYHSHCQLDDGKGTINEYAVTAISKNFSIIGISPHAPVPVNCGCTLTEDNLNEYLRLMPTIINYYSDKLEVLTGLEIDYIPGLSGPSDQRWNDLNLDYRIGSVHLIDDPETGEHIPIDDSPENIFQLLKHKFDNNIKALVSDYFERQSALIETKAFDILGHCDLKKKYNKNNLFFNQEDKWYKKTAMEMLEVAAINGTIVEVNTGGLSRNVTTEVYPSPWMLKKAFKLGIPLVVSSDAHYPEHIDYYFNETFALLKSMGYGEIYFLSKGRWYSQPLY